MKYTVHIGDRPIVLEHDDLDDSINVDDLTKVDTSNIFGEAVTISAAVNRIGLLKADLESVMADLKLELKIFEGTFISKLRKQAAESGGFYKLRIENEDVKIKATEKALETSFETDPEWIKLKKEYIRAERNSNRLASLYWSVQDKARKINGLVSGTTPAEFVEELIAGKINGILVKKK